MLNATPSLHGTRRYRALTINFPAPAFLTRFFARTLEMRLERLSDRRPPGIDIGPARTLKSMRVANYPASQDPSALPSSLQSLTCNPSGQRGHYPGGEPVTGPCLAQIGKIGRVGAAS
jgi:hypothetical protein